MLVEFKASATRKASSPDTIMSSDKVDSSVYHMGFVNVYNVCGIPINIGLVIFLFVNCHSLFYIAQ